VSATATTATSGSPTVVAGGTWVVDLDGVVWLAGEPIGEVARAIGRLRGVGVDVLFVTNNSAPSTGELLARLSRAGVTAGPADVLSSADAAASLLADGQRAGFVGGDGLREALERRGVVLTSEPPVDAVVVGWTQQFDFDQLTEAATLARSCGRLIGTNEDPTHPTPQGLLPGTGSLLAAVATASGLRPEVAGKPHAALVSLVRQRIGPPDRLRLVVGDQPRTDGVLAQQLGVPFALVDSGVTPAGTPSTVPVAHRAADLSALVDELVAAHGPPH
jgi:4-nitrophenyl phosphatase